MIGKHLQTPTYRVDPVFASLIATFQATESSSTIVQYPIKDITAPLVPGVELSDMCK